MLEFIVWQMSV